MLIHSDWHIHSDASYDSTLPLSEIIENAKRFGFRKIGIADHLNFNDEKFIGCLRTSAKNVKALQNECPNLVLGVELTPIEKPLFDYIQKHGTRDGYVAPQLPEPYAIMLGMTKEELMELGVRYAVGAAHWRVDGPRDPQARQELNSELKEWHRQQLYLACDERVTILGHPWYHGHRIWYADFSLIPHSMNLELGDALKENGKFVECNTDFFRIPETGEKFRNQYAEFLRELFEMGIPVTYGSDAHNSYPDKHTDTEPYLAAAGFVDGDFAELTEDDLW